MKNICFLLLMALDSCNTFDSKILEQDRYDGGRDYESGKPIQAKPFYFGDYTVVVGFDTIGYATIGLYFGSKEIFASKFQDGEYDTIVQVNLNNDGVPDFLISYSYEDGADLGAIISQSKFKFNEKFIASDFWGVNCNGDMSPIVEFPLVNDVDHDGKGEVILRYALKGGKPTTTPCTDTVFIDR